MEQIDANYNYHDNSVLVQAIKAGYRGAYWDILRRIADFKSQIEEPGKPFQFEICNLQFEIIEKPGNVAGK